MKLRKHIRNSVLTGIRQLGRDRVVDFQFGYDEKAAHVILEMYASGNIILTNSSYTILSLLRRHTYDGDVKVAVREVYPVAVAARQEALVASADADADADATESAAGADGTADGATDGASSGAAVTVDHVGAFLEQMHARQLTRKQRNKASLKQTLSTAGSGCDFYGYVVTPARPALLCFAPHGSLFVLRQAASS